LTVTLYLSGKIGRFRADINFENQEYSAFFDGDGEIWCAPDPGLILDGMESPSRDGACARESEAATGGSLVLMAFGPLFVPGAYTDVTITSKRRETILGQRADCYTEQLEETVDLEYCFSADSMLLRVGSNEAGLTLQRYEATQIEEATDQDFEPPYPIVDTE
jgi:hypothetical protein